MYSMFAELVVMQLKRSRNAGVIFDVMTPVCMARHML